MVTRYSFIAIIIAAAIPVARARAVFAALQSSSFTTVIAKANNLIQHFHHSLNLLLCVHSFKVDNLDFRICLKMVI